jgi:hypothetical protein
MSSRSRIAATLALAGCAACSSAPALDCPAVSQQQLTHATARESYLALGQAQIRAIAEIRAHDDAAQSCSGVFVAPGYALTAKHCLEIAKPDVVTASGASALTLPVLESTANPTLDLALLRVDAAALNSPDEPLTPIPTASLDSTQIAAGDAAELAGYGLTETGSSDELRYLVEVVSSVSNGQIVVDGLGRSGACEGDSGGPLLVRSGAGTVSVAGILSAGSSTCLGKDDYVTVAPAASWLASVVGSQPAPSTSCGALTTEGRCFRGTPVWCQAGELNTDACGPGRACGWDEAIGGFRCIEPANDSCVGVDSVGSCREGAALRCNQGRLVREACAPCGACQVDAETGEPHCTLGAAAPMQ